MKRSGQRLGALGVSLAFLAGCAPGSAAITPAATTASTPTVGASAGASPAVAPSAAPSFDITTPVTLTVWDTETAPGTSAAMDALNAAFSAKYPNVTIKRTAKNFDDYVVTIKLAASAPDAPDVFEGNEGYQVDAALVKAGLIIPLDDLAQTYGWEARFGSPATLDVLRW